MTGGKKLLWSKKSQKKTLLPKFQPMFKKGPFQNWISKWQKETEYEILKSWANLKWAFVASVHLPGLSSKGGVCGKKRATKITESV
jgi:hypothetical protein